MWPAGNITMNQGDVVSTLGPAPIAQGRQYLVGAVIGDGWGVTGMRRMGTPTSLGGSGKALQRK